MLCVVGEVIEQKKELLLKIAIVNLFGVAESPVKNVRLNKRFIYVNKNISNTNDLEVNHESRSLGICVATSMVRYWRENSIQRLEREEHKVETIYL